MEGVAKIIKQKKLFAILDIVNELGQFNNSSSFEMILLKNQFKLTPTSIFLIQSYSVALSLEDYRNCSILKRELFLNI